jgi:hypothetical protein
MTHTADAWFAPHNMPSGGDWAIARVGAVLLAGTEGALIESVNFTRCESNGVFLSGAKNGIFFLSFPYVCPEPVLVKCSFSYINGSKRPFFAGYNRDARIIRSSFEWLGASAIASEGFSQPAAPTTAAATAATAKGQAAQDIRTDTKEEQGEEVLPDKADADMGTGMPLLPAGIGVDATGGDYPQGTLIGDAWVHDIGLLQKQSSAYFTVRTCFLCQCILTKSRTLAKTGSGQT